MGANKIKELWYLSQTKSVWVFILGNTWSNKMSNQERIGLEGMIKAYAGCSRIIATIQRASSTERDHLGCLVSAVTPHGGKIVAQSQTWESRAAAPSG